MSAAPSTSRWTAEPWTSGIYKSPVLGRVSLSRDESRRRRQADLKVHGGPDKAVCVYSADHYPFWRQELGVQECGPGWFGENFSVEGQSETDVADRRHVPHRHSDRADLAAARAVLEARPPLESPRHAEAGRAERPHRMVPARAETGEVECGDALTLVDRPFRALDDRRGQRRRIQPRRDNRHRRGTRAGGVSRRSPNRGAEASGTLPNTVSCRRAA